MDQRDPNTTPEVAVDDTRVSVSSVVNMGAVLSGTYRIVRKIASGGMGVVFEAEHLRLGGHRVAVKVLLPDVARDSETIARFRREAEICSRLQHPHIVKVTDFNAVEDGTPYFVMEYLEGESLTIRLARGPSTLGEAMAILEQMGSALEAAHGQGIVHRDLKPSNVFLARTDPAHQVSGFPTVKILDFGISKILTEGTLLDGKSSALLGTPRYMSPEQAEGRNDEVGPASDQFSLAAIASELLSGQRAFPGDKAASILYLVVHGEPAGLDAIRKNYPSRVAGALRRAMSKDPAKRFPSVSDFLEVLTKGIPVAAKDSPTLTRKKAIQKKARPSSGRLTIFLAFLMASAVLASAVWALLPFLRGEITVSKSTGGPSKAVRPGAAGVEKTVKHPAWASAEGKDREGLMEQKVDDLLDEARQQYDQKKYKETIRMAGETLKLKPSGRAYVLITLSHCALGEAKPAGESLLRVPDARKRGTIAQCRHLGCDLKMQPEGKEP